METTYAVYEKNHVAVHKDGCSSFREDARIFHGIASIQEALRWAFGLVGNRDLTICKRCFPNGIHLDHHYRMLQPVELEHN